MKRLREQFKAEISVLSVLALIVCLNILGNHNAMAADEVPAFFLKIAKNIPRLGRSYREDFTPKNTDDNDSIPWYDRMSQVRQISKRKVDFSPGPDTWSWEHFPLAIEGPPELWRTLAGYSDNPLYKVSDNFNNEMWARDKRIEDGSTQKLYN